MPFSHPSRIVRFDSRLGLEAVFRKANVDTQGLIELKRKLLADEGLEGTPLDTVRMCVGVPQVRGLLLLGFGDVRAPRAKAWENERATQYASCLAFFFRRVLETRGSGGIACRVRSRGVIQGAAILVARATEW
jgi:hypothetical protein